MLMFYVLAQQQYSFWGNISQNEKFFFEKIEGKYVFSLQFQLNLLFLGGAFTNFLTFKIEKKHIFIWQ